MRHEDVLHTVIHAKISFEVIEIRNDSLILIIIIIIIFYIQVAKSLSRQRFEANLSREKSQLYRAQSRPDESN